MVELRLQYDVVDADLQRQAGGVLLVDGAVVPAADAFVAELHVDDDLSVAVPLAFEYGGRAAGCPGTW